MPKIRVLVVDDSVVIRRVVADELATDPAIEIAGTAANGQIALARMTQVNPDLVILDVEMPDMDGLETLARLRKDFPRIPVIMFSALTERGASATLDALALGAVDYFTKPSGSGGLDSSRQLIRDELIPAVKEIAAKAIAKAAAQTMPLPPLPPSSPLSRQAGASDAGFAASFGTVGPTGASSAPGTNSPVPLASTAPGLADVVAIGVSTGGPNALAEVFRALPARFPVPILIVQHMPPMFTRLLAERLTANSNLVVEEAVSGALVEPGHAYVAPGDYHMVVVREGLNIRLLTHQDPPENSCRPAADPLFRSVAKVYGARALAVVLTGMGQDGLRGCEFIREARGQIIAQDEATSVVWGMPGFVARAGLADKVLPLAMVANEMIRRVGGPRR